MIIEIVAHSGLAIVESGKLRVESPAALLVGYKS